MAGAYTTLTILDGGGTSRTTRAWDESGSGTGPYTFDLSINVSAGSSQFALAIVTNTTLTVPAGSRLAMFSVEGGDLRWTDDGTSASTTVGHPRANGSSWTFYGPLAAMKFTSVTGSPTLNVSYYK
jgi:hypothetical protein